ncbi:MULTISPECIES: hypothetical protein [Brevibacterium]|uniref:Uncharacterized protein n=2 Tax=Brevibacterium TaxID=1696 RepID=A0ABP9TZ93_9MICO
MKKALIALTAVLSAIAVAVGALFIWEYRSKAQLEAQVEDYLGECNVKSENIEVHGRPFILSAIEDKVDLTYVDLAPAPGTNKDQILIHRLSNGRADRLTRFITFDYPQGDVRPVTDADGAFTDKARLDGKEVTFTASMKGKTLSAFGNKRSVGEVKLTTKAELLNVSATDKGIVAELEYPGNGCS